MASPFLDAWIKGDEAGRQQGVANMQQLQLMGQLSELARKQQEELALRRDLQGLGDNPTDEQLSAVARQHGGANAIMSDLTRRAQVKATKENALSRIELAERTHNEKMAEMRAKNLTAEQTASLNAWDKQVQNYLRNKRAQFSIEGGGMPGLEMPSGAPPVVGRPAAPVEQPPAQQGSSPPMSAAEVNQFAPQASAVLNPALAATQARITQAEQQPNGGGMLPVTAAIPDARVAPAVPPTQFGPGGSFAPVANPGTPVPPATPPSGPTAGAQPVSAPTAPVTAAQVVAPVGQPSVAQPAPKFVTYLDAPQGMREKEAKEWARDRNQSLMRQETAQGKATLNLTGGRESVYVQRMMMGANQAAKDLSNVVQLPMTASTGMFGGRKQAGGLLDAGKEVLANTMTTQEVQAYNAMATGFQRSLAQIESAGLMPSGSLTHQMDAVLFKEGDTNLTKMHKLAQTRQIIEAGMEVIDANPRVSQEEKGKIKAVLDSVRKSVPFTHSDLIALQNEQTANPGATLGDIVGGKKPAAGGWSIRPR